MKRANDSRRPTILEAAIETHSTEQIAEMLRETGAGWISDKARRITRATLLLVYGERMGLAAADALIDEMSTKSQ